MGKKREWIICTWYRKNSTVKISRNKSAKTSILNTTMHLISVLERKEVVTDQIIELNPHASPHAVSDAREGASHEFLEQRGAEKHEQRILQGNV